MADYAGEMPRTAVSAGRRTPAARRRIVAGAAAAACALGAASWLLLGAATRAALPDATPFTIAGAPGTLPPGVPVPLDLRVENPNPFALRLTSLTVTVAARTSVAGCDGARDFRVTGLARPVEVPARSSAALTALGVPRAALPTVTAPGLPGRCARARVVLRYAGRATPPR